jgi:adenosylcobinamide-phosphate synthase
MIDLAAAVIIDLIIGDPPSFPHPVRFMGNLISFEDKLTRRICKNNSHLYMAGLLIVLFNVSIAFLIPYLLLRVIKPYTVFYHAVNIYILYTCIAARCLQSEAVNIYKAFSKGLDEARQRLSYIVGRETGHLDEGEIVRATVETVAENTSDGVIAPILYAIIGGAPLAVAYKMINTMDSMLGYMSEKYRYIGFFPAKTDDVFNFIPARLTGLLMCISGFLGFDVIRGLKVMIRDRKNHKSPNCAYPEGAAAGLLGVRLGGDNIYFGEVVKKPTIGDKTRELGRDDIKRTIEIMYRAEFLLMALYILITGVVL